MNFDILLPIKPYYAYLIMKGDYTDYYKSLKELKDILMPKGEEER